MVSWSCAMTWPDTQPTIPRGLKETLDTTRYTLRHDDQEFIVEASMAGLPMQYEYDLDGYSNWFVRRAYVITSGGRVLAERIARALKYE